MRIIENTADRMQIDLPSDSGEYDMDRGYRVFVEKFSWHWRFELVDEGCDVVLQAEECEPNIKALSRKLGLKPRPYKTDLVKKTFKKTEYRTRQYSIMK